jgi:carbon monoxide dehydrogenase subunit G
MQMKDSQTVPASRDKVWAALNDPAVLKQCIPGCQVLDMTSPTEMTATVVIKVGPVKATFGGKVTLSDLDPPNGYRITGEGSGGVAGFAKGGAAIRLEAAGDTKRSCTMRSIPRSAASWRSSVGADRLHRQETGRRVLHQIRRGRFRKLSAAAVTYCTTNWLRASRTLATI